MSPSPLTLPLHFLLLRILSYLYDMILNATLGSTGLNS